MKKGAVITGTVKNGNGKPAKSVKVLAANAAEQSFPVTANDKGQFALGGLPAGSYSVFVYDAGKNWVTNKSTWVPGLKAGRSKNVAIKMKNAAGSLTIDLYTPNGPVSGHPYVTAISKSSGQFWVAKASHGSVVFRGLREGKYKVIVPGVGRLVRQARTGPERSRQEELDGVRELPPDRARCVGDRHGGRRASTPGGSWSVRRSSSMTATGRRSTRRHPTAPVGSPQRPDRDPDRDVDRRSAWPVHRLPGRGAQPVPVRRHRGRARQRHPGQGDRRRLRAAAAQGDHEPTPPVRVAQCADLLGVARPRPPHPAPRPVRLRPRPPGPPY